MELQSRYGELQALDAEVLAISTDDLEGAEWVLERVGITYPILYNPDAGVVRQYGVFNLLGDGLATPATFVIDKEGRIRFRHVGRSIADEPSAEVVLEALQQVADSEG